MSTEATDPTTAATAAAPDTKADKVPTHLRFAGELERTLKRLAQVKSGNFVKLAGRLDMWIDAAEEPELKSELVELKESYQQTLTSLGEVVESLKALPETFSDRARSSGGSKAEIKVGSTVGVIEKRIPSYNGIIQDDELQSFTVAGFRKGFVMVKTPSGESFMLPKAHLAIVVTKPTELVN